MTDPASEGLLSPMPWSDSPKEECGVFGVYHPIESAASLCYFGLFALQHRGQESAGIAVSDGEVIHHVKAMGLVNQVFDEQNLKMLPGQFGIGHTRYSTTGGSIEANAQPIFCQSEVGDIAVAHNGNLVNTKKLREELVADGETFLGDNDSEIIARMLVRAQKSMPLEHAVASVVKRLRGAFSVVILTHEKVMGFRDPNGLRPLSVGQIGTHGFVVASETCAFGPIGARQICEIGPGEMVMIGKEGMTLSQIAPPARPSMCLFEFIYFARPDSRMYGTLLYQARQRMGEALWDEAPVEADIVVPVPDSGIPAALGLARRSGIEFREGMMKSRYIQRTFIEPEQRIREWGVRLKLTPLIEHIAGQRIVLVDDSIVRATTTGQIVKMLREAGATEVHVRITAPPIKWPCFYGIDMAKRKDLAAARMTIEQIQQHIGADSLAYLSIDGATKAVRGDSAGFCLACFNGDYPIEVPQEMQDSAFSLE